MFDSKESRLQNLLQSQSSRHASEDLEQRVARLAELSASTYRHQRAHRQRIRLAVAASVTGILVIGGVAFTPGLVKANVVKSVVQAVDGATSMHVVMYDLRLGHDKPMLEEWYQGGKWRTEGHGQITLWKQGVSYVYTPATYRLEKTKMPDGPFSHNMKSFTMSSMLTGLIDPRGHSAIDKQNLRNGTYRLQFDNEPVHERYVFIVDSKSDLPQSMECQKPENGGWVKKVEARIEFNRSFDASLFEIKAPPGTREIDVDEYRNKLSQQFKPVVATLNQGAKRKMEIHSIDVNARGHVFLTYTGGGHGFFDWFDMKDERGVRYIRADLGNQGNFTDRKLDLKNGKAINIQWWIPTDGQMTYKPHRFTLTSMHQKTKKGDKPGWYTMQEIVELGRCNFETPKQTCFDIPLYLSVLSTGLPSNELTVKRGEAYSLCLYLKSRWVDKSGKQLDDPQWNNYPASTGYKHDPRALRLAEKFAHAEIDLGNEQSGEYGESTGVDTGYFDLFQIARWQGRIAESDTFLRETLKLNSSYRENAKTWLEYESRIGNIPMDSRKSIF